MADVTELRCWPSCVDAIDWSPDGIIALASDERVELLFPHTVSFDRDQDAAQWQHIPLQVSWFTNQELPIKEPAPLANYSIGEEISASAPIAIAWSSPGLAKHRRSALAALTANLVLSIWSADGKPQEALSWSRKLIINNALVDYFLSNATEEPSHVTTNFGERMRLRTRVRAFSWAPAMPNLLSSGTLGTRLSFGQHIVAVCNDDNILALIVVDSPTTAYGTEQNWNAKVLTHVSTTPDSESIFSKPSFFEDVMRQQKHISHVTWSPWIIRGDWYHSVIVYATNDDVRARVVTYTHDSIGLGDEVLYSGVEMRFKGPMKWSPIVDGNVLTLALFTATGLIHLSISASDASIIERSSHNLDGRWDQVSGAIWDSAQHAIPRLHFSSLLSTIQSPTAVLEASSKQLKALDLPSWHDQIVNSAVLFSARNELKGNTKMKVWGLATSPLADFIATCYSVHPSDMMEYGSPNDRRGTVAVSALRQYRQLRKSFPLCDVSAEGVLFTLKKLVENTVEDTKQMPAFIEEIVEKLMQAYGPTVASDATNSFSSSAIDSADLDLLVKEFKRVALFDIQTMKDRYTVLVSQACNLKSANDLQRTLIAYRLATALQDLPALLSMTLFSAEIRDHHCQTISLIQSTIEFEVEQSKPSQARDSGPTDNQADALAVALPELAESQTQAQSQALNLDLAAVKVDTCDFCSAPIPFTDLFKAACTNGHQFRRCGLSFLAIQAPGITKYCGICSTPFLSEEFVIAQEMEQRVRRESEQGDASMLDVPSGGFASIQAKANGDEIERIDDRREPATRYRPRSPRQDQRNSTGHDQPIKGACEALATEERRRELPVTVARVLFLACDVCIYCGGKFVG